MVINIQNISMMSYLKGFIRKVSHHCLLVTVVNNMFATSVTGTADPSGAPEFTPGFQWGSRYSIFSFVCMFCRSLFVLFILFHLAIVLSVLLRLMDSDYPFGISKLFSSLHPVLYRVRVAQSLVFSCIVLYTIVCPLFSFDTCIACPPSIYAF